MEQVFAVRRADHFDGRWPQGVLRPPAPQTVAEAWVRRGFFVERGPAEQDPALKQLIPYCVITRGDEIFQVRRRRRGNESRLHGLYSVGLGGHIGPEDGAPDDPNFLEQALLRELNEELRLPPLDPSALRLAGFVNDDANPVGRVHVGLVFRMEMRLEDRVEIREIQKLHGGFAPLVELQDLWQDPSRFEGWSRLVLEAFFNLPRQGEVPTSTDSD